MSTQFSGLRGDHETWQYLERATLAARYLRNSQKLSQIELIFLTKTCMDVVGAKSASIWICSSDGNWDCKISTVPLFPTLEKEVLEKINIEAMHSRDVIELQSESKKNDSRHLVVG
ncbi:MAG: hypothetical protein ACKOXT_04360, partial [Actinomycetota bacterium]